MKTTDDMSKLRKPALAIIGFVVVFFIVMIGLDDDDSVEDRAVVADKKEVVADDKISDTQLYFDCKPKIQAQLANPKSFDPSALSMEYNFVDNQHLVSFDFYAENGFGGEVMQKAICSFDADGNILDYGVV